MPEFKGNVFAVQTGDCWDPQLDELKERGGKVKAKDKELRAQGLEGAELREALDAFRAELYTAEEREILKGSSNQGYHYMGSAKITGRIGVAFAEALLGD